MGQMAETPNPEGHLETVEAAQDESEEPEETGDASMAGLPKREHLKRILGGSGSGILTRTITNEGLVQAGYYSILNRYESLHSSD